MNKTIDVLIPDGVGIRNFVIGPFLTGLKKVFAAVAIHHTIPPQLMHHFQGEETPGMRWQSMLDYQESRAAMFLRQSLAYAHSRWANTRTMQIRRHEKIRGTYRTRWLHRVARLMGNTWASRGGIRWLDARHENMVLKGRVAQAYRQQFQKHRPAIVFCTHQRPPAMLPAVAAAKSLGIPTAVFIFSWDNLSSTGRMPITFDHYLVWSQLMADELLQLYPDTPPEHIHIVGTPQFDPYADQSLLWPREEFFARINADARRPLICYSGGDRGACPEGERHVRVLMELVAAQKISGDPQVLLRPAPVDDGRRYESVRQDYPQLLYHQPEWIHSVPGDWSKVIPTFNDVQFLVNLTHYCDVNINMASTMTLDFALHDKPVVNIAFDISDPPPFGRPLWDWFYQYDHLQPVIELQATRIARSPAQLAEHINSYLEHPEWERENRKKLVDLEIGCPVGHASKKVVDALINLGQ